MSEDSLSKAVREAIEREREDVPVTLTRGEWFEVAQACQQQAKYHRGIAQRSRYQLTKMQHKKLANGLAVAYAAIKNQCGLK